MMIKEISATKTTAHLGFAKLENVQDPEDWTKPQAVSAQSVCMHSAGLLGERPQFYMDEPS